MSSNATPCVEMRAQRRNREHADTTKDPAADDDADEAQIVAEKSIAEIEAERLRQARDEGNYIDLTWDKDTCVSAAKGGNLEVLQWTRANGCPWDEHTCGNAAYGWSQETFSSAAEYYGYLKVLQWAPANGCPGFPRVATEDGRTSNSSIQTHGVGRQHIFGRLLVLSVGLGIFLFKLLVVFRVV